MNTFSIAAAIALAMAFAPAARATELRVLAGGGMAGEWALLKPKFEQASGHKLEIFFGTTPNLIKEATSGKPFDVAIVPAEFMRDAGARAKLTAGSTIDIARVGLGVAVRAGTAKPDVGSAEAFKSALLNAQSPDRTGPTCKGPTSIPTSICRGSRSQLRPGTSPSTAAARCT